MNATHKNIYKIRVMEKIKRLNPPGVLSSLSEREAFDLICMIRWPDTEGAPACPHCGSQDIATYNRSKNLGFLFFCKPCSNRVFSPRYQSIFHRSTLSFQAVLILLISYRFCEAEQQKKVEKKYSVAQKYKGAILALPEIWGLGVGHQKTQGTRKKPLFSPPGVSAKELKPVIADFLLHHRAARKSEVLSFVQSCFAGQDVSDQAFIDAYADLGVMRKKALKKISGR